MSENREIYDITIIGGGPVGLFAAFYFVIKESLINCCLVVQRLPCVKGRCLPVASGYRRPKRSGDLDWRSQD